MTENVFYNTAEAAAYLGLSDRTLRTMCENRKITHQRLNNRNIRFKKEWLDEYLKSTIIEAENKEE